MSQFPKDCSMKYLYMLYVKEKGKFSWPVTLRKVIENRRKHLSEHFTKQICFVYLSFQTQPQPPSQERMWFSKCSPCYQPEILFLKNKGLLASLEDINKVSLIFSLFLTYTHTFLLWEKWLLKVERFLTV